MSAYPGGLLSSHTSIIIIFAVILSVTLVLVFNSKLAKRFKKWHHNSLVTGVTCIFSSYALIIFYGESCDDSERRDKGTCVLNNDGMSDFYVSGITLGIALIAALFAAQVIYYNRLAKKKELWSKLGVFFDKNLLASNKEHFDKVIKASLITSVFAILISVVNLFFNLEDTLLVHSVGFGLYVMSTMYSARVFIMSLSVEDKDFF